MTIFILQITAMVTMLCDHMGALLFGNAIVFRAIGRIAFPLYAFMFAEGFRHYGDDKERLTKHVCSTITLAMISEFCYDFARGDLSIDRLFISQNVIFTFALSMVGLYAIKYWKDKPFCLISTLIFTLFVARAANFEYTCAGVLLVYLFYIYLSNMHKFNFTQRLCALLTTFAWFLVLYHWQSANFGSLDDFLQITQTKIVYYTMYVVPLALLFTYNGKQGYSSGSFKLTYRVFYPVHLVILGFAVALR